MSCSNIKDQICRWPIAILVSAMISASAAAKTADTVAEPGAQASQAEAAFILNRAGFGPTPEALQNVRAIGVDAWLDQQLHPERIETPDALKNKLTEFDSLKATPAQLYQSFGPPGRKAANGNEDLIKIVDKNQNDVADQSRAARLLQAIYSPAQLQEALVDFWFNHYNVFVGKDQEDKIWTGTYERDAIRPYVFGRFRELLGATAKHPAMLYYLDNWQSKTAVTDKNGKTSGGLNENYAREVMELHTLGVDGGYSQKDVTELARILTGWGFDPKAMSAGESPAGPPDEADGFHFDAKRHDADAKTFLGQDFPAGGGQEEGERALDLLAASPKTAHRIAYQLAQYFVADVPPPRLVDRLTRRYLDTDGDLREVTTALVRSPEFRDPKLAGAKFKTPLQYVVSAVRATGEPGIVNLKPLLGTLNQLGEPLYGCITPDGYKNTEAAWLNSDAMIDRLNFATALGGGYLPLLKPDVPTVAADTGMSGGSNVKPAAVTDKPKPPDADAMTSLFSTSLSPTTDEALAAAKPQQRAGLLLGSPEFMRR